MFLDNLPRRAMRKLMTRLGVWSFQVQAGVAERTLPKFANNPKHLIIDLPRRIIHPERISLGDHVWLGPGCFISAVLRYPSPSLKHPERDYEMQTFDPRIRIGDRITSSGNLIIGAVQEVTIEDDVLLAFNVTLLDNLHGYENPNVPYKYQPLSRIAPVWVKRGCWIGQNVVILPGVTVGEMCVIGANSVVTRSVPDRCIAVGAPAKVIKKWNSKLDRWEGCSSNGKKRTQVSLADARPQ